MEQGKSIQGFTVTEMLQIISMSKKTGLLQIRYEDEELVYYFQNGKIVGMESAKERLGSVMLRMGIINEKDLQEAIQVQKTTKRESQLHDILLDMGKVSIADYKKCLSTLIEETLYDLFHIEGSSYSFSPQTVRDDKLTVPPISIENILMEGARRVDEWSKIREVIPDNSVVFTPTEDFDSRLEQITLLEFEFDILKFVDGKRSIGEITTLSGYDELKVYQTLYGFYLGGLIKKSEMGTVNRKKILVIDDSLTIQKMVELSLVDQNYEIHTASDGKQGLTKIKEVKPDLILLDVTLPQMSGYDVCHQLKRDKYTRKIPIVMLTARDKMIEQFRGKWAGANFYMGKPFSSDELIKKVREFIK